LSSATGEAVVQPHWEAPPLSAVTSTETVVWTPLSLGDADPVGVFSISVSGDESALIEFRVPLERDTDVTLEELKVWIAEWRREDMRVFPDNPIGDPFVYIGS
jgi:hypothetical protein